VFCRGTVGPGARAQVLALFLAKQVVELHHGTISVSNELRKGSEFAIQFHGQTQQLEE